MANEKNSYRNSPDYRELNPTDFLLHTSEGDDHRLSFAAGKAVEVSIVLDGEQLRNLAASLNAAVGHLDAAMRTGKRPVPHIWSPLT